MEDSDSGVYGAGLPSCSSRQDSHTVSIPSATIIGRKFTGSSVSLDSGQGTSNTSTPFPALARNISGSSTKCKQSKIIGFVRKNLGSCQNLEEFEKMVGILDKEVDDVRKQLQMTAADRWDSIREETHYRSVSHAANRPTTSEFTDRNLDQPSRLSSISISPNHRNAEVTACITLDLKEESIVLVGSPQSTYTLPDTSIPAISKQESRSDVATTVSDSVVDIKQESVHSVVSSCSGNSALTASNSNTGIMDLKQGSVVSSHSENSADIIISDPTTSSTELKQESLIGSQSVDDSDDISIQSSQEASEELGSSCIIFLNSVVPLNSSRARVSDISHIAIAICRLSYLCIAICTCIYIYIYICM